MNLLPQDGLYAESWELRAPHDVRSGILVHEGDLLLAKITPCMENGRQGIVRGLPNGWGYATTEVIPLQCTGVSTEFLAFYLKLPGVRNFLASKMEGATGRQRLPRAVVDALAVALPPLSEQRAIAHVLRTVQRAKEATERVIAAARELKRSLMRHLFTYGPVAVEDAERVPLKETEIGPVPEHWAVVRLGDTCSISTGTTPSTSRQDYYEDYCSGGVPFIKTAEIANNVIDRATTYISERAIKDYHLKLYPPGTVFLAMYGQGKTRGQVALLNLSAATTQNAAAIVPGSRLDSWYLWLYLMSRYEGLRGEGIQGHISHLNLGYVKQIAIAVPPEAEQQAISQMLSAVDKKLRAEENRGRALAALFQTLLHHLMTGKVRVKDLPSVLPVGTASTDN